MAPPLLKPIDLCCVGKLYLFVVNILNKFNAENIVFMVVRTLARIFTTVLKMVIHIYRPICTVCMHATFPTDAGCPTPLTHICTSSTTYLPHHTCISNHLIATRPTLKLLDAFWRLLSRYEQRERNNI